jgi:hypothetical protein
MRQLVLNAFDGLPGIALVPMPVEGFSHDAELDNEVAREVLWLDLAPFLPPEAEEGGLIIAHDDPGVRAADEEAAVCPQTRNHGLLRICSTGVMLGTDRRMLITSCDINNISPRRCQEKSPALK